MSFRKLVQDAVSEETKKESMLSQKESKDDVLKFFTDTLGNDVVLHATRLVEDAIKFITKSKAFFRERDVVRGALNQAQRKVNEEVLEKKEFVDLVEWLVSRQFYTLDPSTRFVEIGQTGYLTTEEMWDMETSIIRLAGEKDDKYKQPQDVFERAIARKKGISQEQTDAVVAACLSPKRVTVIEGSAGAGKSFTMEAVKEIYQEMGYDVIGTALGWNAAKVLSASAKLDDAKCVAVEGLTRGWLQAKSHGIDPFTGPTLIIVDEAGMVGTRHMSIILEETANSIHPVKVVLTGDSLQVIPVDAGAALETIIAWHGTARIETIRRQHQPSHRKSVYRFSQKHSGEAIHTFLQQECFRWCRDKDMLINKVAQDYVSYRMAYPDKKALVLTLANKDVLELNFRIRAAYRKMGLIGQEDVPVKVTNGRETFEAQFSVGDDILLRANDKDMIVYDIDEKKSPYKKHTWKPSRLGIFNRNQGRIVAIQRSKEILGSYDFVIDLQGDNPGRVVINSERYGKSDFSETSGMPMIHNYAGTIYGSQGQTVNHVLMIDSDRMDFRLSYVGMSRHKESVDVYLDETDLHRRLDKVTQKRQSLESRIKMIDQGKSMDDAYVDTGRYTRSEMLNAVSLCWGKHSENLTAAMFEQLKRRPEKTQTRELQKLAKVKSSSLKETIIDFLPEINKPYPIVDLDAVLNLPDPIVESELIRPSDVEENKKNYAGLELPVDVDKTPIPQSPKRVETSRLHVGSLPTEKKEQTFFSRLLGLVEPKAPPVPKAAPQLRHNVLKDAFEDVEGLEKDEEIGDDVLKRLNAWLRPTPKIKVPFKNKSDLCGSVIYPPSDPDFEKECREKEIPDPRPHYVSFDGVPSVLNVAGGPDPEWVSGKRFDMWDVGRFGEPRVLAKSPEGHVIARYRLDGTCVVGEGFPPICSNKQGNAETPVYIVAGAKEWFWLRQSMEERHKDDPSKIPHCIWAAKDVDWSLFAPSLNGKKIVVVRSKADDRQIPWALDMKKFFKEKLNIEAHISPPLPVAVPPAARRSPSP